MRSVRWWLENKSKIDISVPKTTENLLQISKIQSRHAYYRSQKRPIIKNSRPEIWTPSGTSRAEFRFRKLNSNCFYTDFKLPRQCVCVNVCLCITISQSHWCFKGGGLTNLFLDGADLLCHLDEKFFSVDARGSQL